MFIYAADVSHRKKIKKPSKKHNIIIIIKMYENELYMMRRLLDQKGYLYAKCPSDLFIYGSTVL